MRRVQSELFDMVVEEKLNIPVQAVYPMEKVAEACKILTDRKVRGKVVITMND